MTRRSDQLDRIEKALAHLDDALAGHATHLRDQAAAIRIEVRDARSSAEAAHAGVQALHDMLPITQAHPETAPHPPAVPQAADGGTAGDSVPPVRRVPKTLRKDQM